MADKFQIHQSGLELASHCGEAFRRRYIEGEKTPPRSYLAVGQGVDRGVRSDLGNRILTGSLLPLEKVLDLARDQTEGALLDFEPEEEEIEEHGSRDRVKGAAIDKAVRLSMLHHLEVAPKIMAQDVARQFCLTLPGYDFEMAGEIDVREVIPAGASKARALESVIPESDEHLRELLSFSLEDQLAQQPEDMAFVAVIRDTKTTKATPSKGNIDRSVQLDMYALAEKVMEKKLPGAVALDTLVDLKRGPKVHQEVSKRSMRDLEPLLNRVQALAEAVEKGGPFLPAPASHWKCSKKYCGYFETCGFAKGRSSFAIAGGANIAPTVPLQERINRPIQEVLGE